MVWNDFTFTEDDVEECDYLVILDYPKKDFEIKVSPDNIIHLCLEPPNEVSKYRQYANKQASLICAQIPTGKNTILSHGALPWHIDQDFDFLNTLQPGSLKKKNQVVWITSDQRSSKGHHSRMKFLDTIRELPNISLYGRGINPINDKWEVLSNSKYGIAYENFNNQYYWTEKISDCFLSYTLPLYFGCTEISNYFPENSYIQIDPKDKHIDLFFKELLESNKWEKSIEAIREARERVLFKYQLFPFLYDQISSMQAAKGVNGKEPKLHQFKGGDSYFDNYPIKVKLEKEFEKFKRNLRVKLKV
ncbi:glycosyltransferase family 10 domain-containing protein [Salinimicrobium oceani]|uniref:Fucosyltransferase C-terminal domain-containing protein n=1 Tax=Salinimicrobium oceani TaxID=2722702 RepID=A0ABX1D381_9FLAO|nr:glycosyltransferase family 10 [Salinimicrobium oceani]NJW53664.1 hypothetical protein [Salinimicrobium oceani]